MSVNDIKEKLNLSFQSANLLVKEFESTNLLREHVGARRNRIFYLWEYLEMFEL